MILMVITNEATSRMNYRDVPSDQGCTKTDQDTKLVEGENNVAQSAVNGTAISRCACNLSWSEAPI